MEHAIQTQDLSRSFGRTTAVQGLTLRVPVGSVFAFVGPNGAGKTTTIKLLMNLLRPSSGTARVLDVDSRRVTAATRQRIGYVSENQELPLWMTTRELMQYCAPLYRGWDHGLARDLADRLALPLDRALRACSRGMRMKAALLVSLAYRPELLVMDEPFAGLDALVREELSSGLLDVAGDRPWTVFLSSHDIDEVERLADWIGIIDKGRLVLAEPVASLLQRFREVVVTFDAEPRLPPDVPRTWLTPSVAGHAVRFVESAFDETDGESRIRAALQGARAIAISAMSLRSIFVALARAFRLEDQR
jgi:ABC-2 type transport system ATP-binding protein